MVPIDVLESQVEDALALATSTCYNFTTCLSVLRMIGTFDAAQRLLTLAWMYNVDPVVAAERFTSSAS
jgi:hypothetical protein